MLATLGEAKDSSILEIAGVSTGSPRFLQLLNEATRVLMRRGDWEGTVLPIYTCVARGCVVWPRYVGEVRKINVCNQSIPVENGWYRFMEWHGRCDRNHYGWQDWLGEHARLENRDHLPVFQSILGDNRTIRVYSFTPLDNGKTVQLFGEDCNGQPLTTKGAGGWRDGITITLQAPYVETTITVRRIDRVLKSLTQGPVRLYANNSGTLEDVAYYEPSETNPNYQRSTIFICGCSTSCASTKPVVAMVKLAFVPARVDTDLVLISNLDALKLAMQSQNFGDAGDFANKRAYLADAVSELNAELQDRNPDDQIPVDMGEFGRTNIGQQRCF